MQIDLLTAANVYIFLLVAIIFHYGLAPIGINVHVILISVIDEDIHYAVQSTTVTEDHVVTIDNVESISERST